MNGSTSTEVASTRKADTENEVVVEVRDVVKIFDGVRALDGVSTTIRRGERVAILGGSGSGKSTLLRHLNALETATGGRVEVLGRNMASLHGRPLRLHRSHVGMIFQHFDLVDSLSALENVLHGVLARLRGPRLGLTTYPKRHRALAMQLLTEVGMQDRAFQRADTLSGGQRQRVAIARALMQNPTILLADEPVASLDPTSSAQIMALLARISSERGLTVVCSLHQIDIALEWSERIIGLRSGRIHLDTPTENSSRTKILDLYSRDDNPVERAEKSKVTP